MVQRNQYRWRKVTDVDRKHATFEMMLDDIILADIGFSDSGVMEIVFHEGIVGRILDWSSFQSSIEEGKKIAELDD